MPVPLNVLIVEDSENDAILVLRALQRSGFDPVGRRVGNEAELSDALRQSSWEIVLCDYSLPGLGGPAALALVGQLRPDTPFILVSDGVGEDAAVAMMKAGAHDFILKSDLARLGPAVERELREVETRRALRQAETELRDREARFRSIIENVSDMIFLVDMQGIIRYHSPSVGRMLGYPAGELTGKPFYDLVHPDDRSCAQESLSPVAGAERPSLATECRVRDSDGSWQILEGIVTNLVDDPAVRGVVCNFRNVTERKRAEGERFRAQRLESIGSLAGGIAHDLNNKLTPILIAADLLIEQPGLDEYQVLLEGLQVSAHRAAEVVQHLLSFARSVGGERQTVDLAHLLRELEQLLQFSLPKSIAVEISAPGDLWKVSGDKTELLQVFVNLCVSARDAMPAGGGLAVEARNITLGPHDVSREPGAEPGAYVHFRVTDTGQGIAPASMGLSTSLNVVRNHGGFMKVYSEPGRGTLVSVYLPAQRAKDAPAAAEAPDLPRGNGEVVLVVDDEASIREVMKETLEAYGYRALTASVGTEALEIQSQMLGQINVAIVDTAMPLMDGPTTIRALKQKEPLLPVILQGGFLSETQEGVELDVDDTLQKPYTTEQVLRSVANVLQQQQRTE